jgi:hypothetical protein
MMLVNLISKKSLVITGLVLVLPGLVFLGLGLWQYLEARSFVNNSVSTQGKVIRMETLSSSDGVMFAPVFEFSDEEGLRYLKASDTGNYPAKYRAGETVEVLYLPDNPIDAKISSNFSVWGGAMILLIIGALFLFFGAVGSVIVLLLYRLMMNRFSQNMLKP